MPVLLHAPLNQDGQNQHHEEGPSAHGARGGLCSNHNQKKIITKKKKTLVLISVSRENEEIYVSLRFLSTYVEQVLFIVI